MALRGKTGCALNSDHVGNLQIGRPPNEAYVLEFIGETWLTKAVSDGGASCFGLTDVFARIGVGSLDLSDLSVFRGLPRLNSTKASQVAARCLSLSGFHQGRKGWQFLKSR